MENISGHLEYLFLGKFTNTLTPDEEDKLAKLFSEDNDAVNKYEEFVLSLNLPNSKIDFERYGSPAFLRNHLPPAIKKRRAMRVIWKRLGATAVAASFIGAMIITWLTINRNEKKETPLLSSSEKYKTIQLQLASGEIVDLAEQHGNFTKSNLQFHNENGTLSYQPGNAAKNGTNMISVPVSMDYRIILSDSSEVWMNSETTIHFPTQFTGGSREITISGEAFLNIKKNNKQPFIVHLPHGSVTVTGTSFNVNSYENLTTKVALVEGSVNFTTDDQTVMINPGIQVTYNKTRGKINKSQFNSQKVLSWQKGLYYFEDASLEEIAPVLHRWFGVTTKIDDIRLTNKRFSGILDKNEPLASFMDDLRAISSIKSILNNKKELHFSL